MVVIIEWKIEVKKSPSGVQVPAAVIIPSRLLSRKQLQLSPGGINEVVLLQTMWMLLCY